MAACYFLGAKSITSKKNGQKYFPAVFLTKSQWGEWETVTKFLSDESIYESVIDSCSVGDPVVCTLDMGGHVLEVVPHESVPSLELDEGD